MSDRQTTIDPEKLPDSPIRGLVVDGVSLSSRYDKRREYETMRDALALVPPYLRREVLYILCDSKHGADYSIAVRGDDPDLARDLARAFTDAFVRVARGFNGLLICHRETWGTQLRFVDPTWPDDEGGGL